MAGNRRAPRAVELTTPGWFASFRDSNLPQSEALNVGKKQYTRKPHGQANQPDEFVSFWQKAYEATLPYTRAILFTVVGAIAVLVAVWVIDHFVTTSREEATETFDHAVRVAEAELITDTAPVKPEDKLPRFKTDKERLEASLAEIDKLETGKGSGQVGRRARLARAGLLFDLGRFPEAEADYRKYLDGAHDDDTLRFLAREGVGLSLEAQGKLDDALAAYKELEPKGGDFYRDRALWDQARVLVKKGDKKGAEAAYRDLLAKVPRSGLKDEVETQLGLLGAPVAPASAGG